MKKGWAVPALLILAATMLSLFPVPACRRSDRYAQARILVTHYADALDAFSAAVEKAKDSKAVVAALNSSGRGSPRTCAADKGAGKIASRGSPTRLPCRPISAPSWPAWTPPTPACWRPWPRPCNTPTIRPCRPPGPGWKAFKSSSNSWTFLRNLGITGALSPSFRTRRRAHDRSRRPRSPNSPPRSGRPMSSNSSNGPPIMPWLPSWSFT